MALPDRTLVGTLTHVDCPTCSTYKANLNPTHFVQDPCNQTVLSVNFPILGWCSVVEGGKVQACALHVHGAGYLCATGNLETAYISVSSASPAAAASSGPFLYFPPPAKWTDVTCSVTSGDEA